LAFNMFDTDSNNYVDINEFLVMERVMQNTKCCSKKKAATSDDTASKLPTFSKVDLVTNDAWWVSKLFHTVTGYKPPSRSNDDVTTSEKPKNEQLLPQCAVHDAEVTKNTTLLRYLFGKNGRNKLTYQDFSKFMDNLQTEVLELEFMEYSKGLPTISESEFGKILLRLTNVKKENHKKYLKHVQNKLNEEKGINFVDFCKFFNFLNNIDDFSLAMHIYTISGQPISHDEFQRAVKACVGYTLNPHLVETVFLIFDQDGDGYLSHYEFICKMKNRLQRGLPSNTHEHHNHHQTLGWEPFKICLKKKMHGPADHPEE